MKIPRKEIIFIPRFISWLAALFALAACSTQRRVLYPNSYLNQVGTGAAELDIQDCIRRPDGYISSDRAREKILEGTAMGAGVGAAVGAASGATRGLIRGLFSKRAPIPVYKNVVNRCLRDKGYDPIGWK